MSEEKKRTIAYLCPQCGQSVMIERTPFQLAASASRLPCPCGKSAVEVELTGERARLRVPCPACGTDHQVSCSTRDLLHRRALAFSCTASGLTCCVVGEEQAVVPVLRRMEQSADKLPASGRREGVFLDEVIMQEVLSELKEIAARGGISCSCGSTRWTMRVDYSSISLTCADCGGTIRIPAACADDLDDICCRDKLVIHGRQ